MEAVQILSRAKTQLILSQPFFAVLALNMEYVPNEKIKTACTDGRRIQYNPKFIESLNIMQAAFVIGHEVMHPALNHHTRMAGRNHKKWNRAADYPINELLFKAGFKEAENWLYDPQYFGMSAEQIYNLLDDEDEDDKMCGEVVPNEGDGSEDAKTEAESEYRVVLNQAVTVAKQQGKLPDFIARVIGEILNPKVSWKEVLSRFLVDLAKDDYTFKKPNPRYIGTGFYLPYLENEVVGNIVMIVDTSTSIDNDLLNKMGGEMQEILSEFNIGFHVIYVDTQVHAPQYIEPDEELNLKPEGGGGTSFVPGFTYIDYNELNPRAVIYFTDGYSSSFPAAPDYPVLWATYNNKNFKPPFGEVIEID